MKTEAPENRKCFEQFCPMATALDFIGDRWTILIIRELLGGAARFGELQDGLQGIAKNLLTSRLRRLENDGIVRRVRSADTVLYALTPRGAMARTALEELAFWGASMQPLVPPRHPRSVRAIAMALHATLGRAGSKLPKGRHDIELDVDGEPIHIVLDSKPSATVGACTEADARLHVSHAAVSDFLGGRLRTKEFKRVSGSEETRKALLEILKGMSAST